MQFSDEQSYDATLRQALKEEESEHCRTSRCFTLLVSVSKSLDSKYLNFQNFQKAVEL